LNMPADKDIGRLNEATKSANAETLLTPRFYTTDFEALNRIDLTPVRAEWDAMMSEFENDSNEDHFQRTDSFTEEIRDLPPALEKEFIEFMISSVTSEYSGCVLYADIAEKVDNPDIQRLMELMRRDEARHAGFINRALKDYGVAVDLGFLKRQKKKKYFRPKFIYYATYLSEKIGYARYITIFRQLEKNPSLRFHPIFRWFERWCNDEFRHGEAFALIMRANPELLRGPNRLWIRFFLNAVYATMYVRDHTRPEMHAAMDFDATDYDLKVFDITSEISKQVFPFVLDVHAPAYLSALEGLRRVSVRNDEAKGQGGLLAPLTRVACGLKAAALFARLMLVPTIPNDLPHQVRLQPAW